MQKTVLSLGCGTGNEISPYTHNTHILGIDINQENCQICKQKFPNGTFLVGDITQTDILQYHPDILLCFEVLEHIDNWQDVLEKTRNLPSGVIFHLSVPYEKAEKKLLSLHENYWKEIGHKHFFTKQKIQKELEKNGWEVKKIQRKNAALFFELILLFKKNAPCIRETYYENILPLWLRVFFLSFRKDLFKTKLKYIPIWILTIPLSYILDPIWGATLEIYAKKK